MKKALKIIAIALGAIILIAVALALLSGGSNQDSLPSPRVSDVESESQSVPFVDSVVSEESSEMNLPMESASLSSSGINLPKISFSGSSSKSSSSEAPAKVDKKVIKTGKLVLKVDKIEKALEGIRVVAESNKGEIFSSNIYQDSSKKAKSGTVKAKVPVDNFETAFEDFKKVASLVASESISGKDVTEEYTDLQSRLKNKQAEEQAIVKILDRAGTIPDVLSVTKELSRVRGEIEVLQGKIKLMNYETEMSTITLDISEDMAVVLTSSWRPLQVIKNSVNSLIDAAQGFINLIIKLVIIVIPVLLLYGLLLLIIYRVGRRIYRKIKGTGAPMQ